MIKGMKQSVNCCSQFHDGEIVPGVFHGGEIEPGTFHKSAENDRPGQTADDEAPVAGDGTETVDPNGDMESEDDHAPQGDGDKV